MNTGSREERQMLTDIGRAADALERIANAMEATRERQVDTLIEVFRERLAQKQEEEQAEEPE